MGLFHPSTSEKAASTPSEHSQEYSDAIEHEAAAINEKKLVRKIDLVLLPAIAVLYLLSFLDRSNVANARVEGLAEDLDISTSEEKTSTDHLMVLLGLTYFPSWQSVFDRSDPFLRRICHIRDTMQYHFEAYHSALLVTDLDDCVRHRSDTDGSGREYDWILHRTIRTWGSRKWT